MINKWEVIFYEDKQGKSEILNFLNELKMKERAKVLAWIEQLKSNGPLLPRPYADILRDSIDELRVKITGSQYRILYFFAFKKIIVLCSVFRKNVKKVPDFEIEKAIKMKFDFLNRFPRKL